jgi:hypothetical protein
MFRTALRRITPHVERLSARRTLSALSVRPYQHLITQAQKAIGQTRADDTIEVVNNLWYKMRHDVGARREVIGQLRDLAAQQVNLEEQRAQKLVKQPGGLVLALPLTGVTYFLLVHSMFFNDYCEFTPFHLMLGSGFAMASSYAMYCAFSTGAQLHVIKEAKQTLEHVTTLLEL